jgi:hypothetical protein
VSAPCRAPILLPEALERPALVRELLEQTAPHFPVQRYFKSGAEMRAQSGPAALIIAPNFRADWATADSRVEGIEPFLENLRLFQTGAPLRHRVDVASGY